MLAVTELPFLRVTHSYNRTRPLRLISASVAASAGTIGSLAARPSHFTIFIPIIRQRHGPYRRILSRIRREWVRSTQCPDWFCRL